MNEHKWKSNQRYARVGSLSSEGWDGTCDEGRRGAFRTDVFQEPIWLLGGVDQRRLRGIDDDGRNRKGGGIEADGRNRSWEGRGRRARQLLRYRKHDNHVSDATQQNESVGSMSHPKIDALRTESEVNFLTEGTIS